MAPRASRDYKADVPYIAPKSEPIDCYPLSGMYPAHNPRAGATARARATPDRSTLLGVWVVHEGTEDISAPGTPKDTRVIVPSTIEGIEAVSVPSTIEGTGIRDIGSRR